MAKIKITESLTWHGLLQRAAMVVVSVVVIVWAMPHDKSTYFHVEEGKPWKYAAFNAPYDFPIYKSEAAIQAERDSAMRNYEPYYKRHKEIETQHINKFMTDFSQGINGLSADYLFVIINRLHSLYQQGIIDQKEYAELASDTSKMIRVVDGKQAVSVSLHEIYSPKTAYEQLFMDSKLSQQRAILQKCNLNDYIVPNLVYDRERSEASKNDMLSGIALASGVVLTCLSCSFYMSSKLGMGPYDAIGWIISERSGGRVPFRIVRILIDVCAVTIGFACSSIVGLGTLVLACGTGPLIEFFNQKVSLPILYGKQTY